ncbi:unnamed protein product [Nezara viridula]|uniref:Uncharacterized protein n=1 Tax=Nezara viridula TaxID=85310 RepID=A0A9P0HEE2_NEZVI|nr:unnamed protein product [Nezara viridula]
MGVRGEQSRRLAAMKEEHTSLPHVHLTLISLPRQWAPFRAKLKSESTQWVRQCAPTLQDTWSSEPPCPGRHVLLHDAPGCGFQERNVQSEAAASQEPATCEVPHPAFHHIAPFGILFYYMYHKRGYN